MTPSSIPGRMDPFRLLNEGFYCDFILLPCSTAWTNTTHSPGHKQRQSFPPILLCFRTFLFHLVSSLFTYIWFSVTSVQRCIPSAVQTCSTSYPFLTTTTRACGMTTHDCTLIRIPNVSLFFTSKHAAQMATGMDDDVPPNVGLGTFFGRTVD